jgi:hypothetical protein
MATLELKLALLVFERVDRMTTLELKLALLVLENVPVRERLLRAVMELQKVAVLDVKRDPRITTLEPNTA